MLYWAFQKSHDAICLGEVKADDCLVTDNTPSKKITVDKNNQKPCRPCYCSTVSTGPQSSASSGNWNDQLTTDI